MTSSPLELVGVADVFASYAAMVRHRLATSDPDAPFRLACSGGSAGRDCLAALVREGIDWSRIEVYLVDERRVPWTSPFSNGRSLAEALGPHRSELAGFFPIDPEAKPEAYAAKLAPFAGRFDLIQLGMGPDGHTASIFPGSSALDTKDDRLVVANVDPSGANPYERITLTYHAIAQARLAVVTVAGGAKHEALRRVVSGEDLPVARVRAGRVVVLVDREAAGSLPVAPLPEELVGGGQR